MRKLVRQTSTPGLKIANNEDDDLFGGVVSARSRRSKWLAFDRRRLAPVLRSVNAFDEVDERAGESSHAPAGFGGFGRGLSTSSSCPALRRPSGSSVHGHGHSARQVKVGVAEGEDDMAEWIAAAELAVLGDDVAVRPEDDAVTTLARSSVAPEACRVSVVEVGSCGTSGKFRSMPVAMSLELVALAVEVDTASHAERLSLCLSGDAEASPCFDGAVSIAGTSRMGVEDPALGPTPIVEPPDTPTTWSCSNEPLPLELLGDRSGSLTVTDEYRSVENGLPPLPLPKQPSVGVEATRMANSTDVCGAVGCVVTSRPQSASQPRLPRSSYRSSGGVSPTPQKGLWKIASGASTCLSSRPTTAGELGSSGCFSLSGQSWDTSSPSWVTASARLFAPLRLLAPPPLPPLPPQIDEVEELLRRADSTSDETIGGAVSGSVNVTIACPPPLTRWRQRPSSAQQRPSSAQQRPSSAMSLSLGTAQHQQQQHARPSSAWGSGDSIGEPFSQRLIGNSAFSLGAGGASGVTPRTPWNVGGTVKEELFSELAMSFASLEEF